MPTTVQLEPAGISDEFYNQIMRENYDNRTLILNCGINEEVIEYYVMYILKWNREDAGLSDEARKDPKRVITIVINSPGGSMMDAWSLIDACLASKTPIRTIGMGMVASAGYKIFLAGDERYAFSHTSFLMHDGETSIENSSSKAKQTMKFFDSMDERSKRYVLEQTNMTEEFYDSIWEQEFWFWPDQGKELGVVHKIIGEDCELEDLL